MPFDSKSGADAGRKGGPNRWSGKDPSTNRTKSLLLKLSNDEIALISEKAKAAGISRVELVIRAVKEYRGATF